MSLSTQISSVVTRIGTEFKTLRATIGSNADLTTTTKSTLVGAINEVKTATASAGAQIVDGTPSTTTVFSSTKTTDLLAAKADLVGGKVPAGQLPAGAINATHKAVADQAAMLALPAALGDFAIRSDGAGTFRLTALPATALASWTLVAAPTDAVTSVAGRTGAVVLAKADVGLGNVDNTTDAAKPVSTATQTALNAKANTASPTFTGTVSGVTKAMVGLGSVDNTADTAKPVSTAQAAAIAALINDTTAAAGTTYSSTKINSAIAAATAALVNSSPAALDTLKELADALGGDANFATTTAAALGNRLRVDASQTLTAAQKAFGIANLGAITAVEIGNPETDFVAVFNTAVA